MLKIFFTMLINSCLLAMPTIVLADMTQPTLGTVKKPLLSTPTLAVTPPTPAISKSASSLKISGYLEGSYNYLLRSNHFSSGSNDRDFDIEQNGLTLNQAALTLAYQPPNGFGGLINFIVGSDPLIFAPFGEDPTTNLHRFGYDAPQVFLQYAKGPVTLMAGKLLSLVGQEEIDPNKNINFSSSFLAFYQPNTHLGVRSTYVINDQITAIAGINNGWDNIRDTSRRKTIELGLAYSLNELLSMSIQGLNGEERSTPATAFGPTGKRSVIDLIATLNATPQLTFVGNYDYGMQTNAALPNNTFAKGIWEGIAGYIHYQFNDQWHSAIRGEVLSDRKGYRSGVAQCLKELTLTVGYIPIKNLEFRAETRHDFSNVSSFVDSNGVNTSNNNQSHALQVIYSFT